eukprot:jgi/Ulvmu1/3397/UM016_0013.1
MTLEAPRCLSANRAVAAAASALLLLVCPTCIADSAPLLAASADRRLQADRLPRPPRPPRSRPTRSPRPPRPPTTRPDRPDRPPRPPRSRSDARPPRGESRGDSMDESEESGGQVTAGTDAGDSVVTDPGLQDDDDIVFLQTFGEEEGDLRLASRVDINGFVTGALQVFLHGAWGAVCEHDFGNAEAAVACRQLGYVGGAAVPWALHDGLTTAEQRAFTAVRPRAVLALQECTAFLLPSAPRYMPGPGDDCATTPERHASHLHSITLPHTHAVLTM